MRVLFTTSDSAFSRLIRHITGEPVSHVAIQLAPGICIHSALWGVRIVPASAFRKKNRIVYEIEWPAALQKCGAPQRAVQRATGQYDFGAFAFLGLALALRRYLRLPLPKSNLWQSTGMHLCTEWAALALGQKPDALLTPYKLYLALKG